MKAAGTKKPLFAKDRAALLQTLQARFEKNPRRHPGLVWAKVQARLEAHADKLWSLQQMENTGGEPDVVAHDKKSGGVCTRPEVPAFLPHPSPLPLGEGAGSARAVFGILKGFG